jgi:hypothetical protein
MIFLRIVAGCVLAVLVLEALMVELESVSPIAGRLGALWYAVLFVVLGYTARRVASTGQALVAVLAGAIAFVTLGNWIAGYIGGGRIAWRWLGPPTTIVTAMLYFFALMAIGIAAASLQLRRKTQ